MTTKYLFPILKDSDKAYPIYIVTVGAENQHLVNRPDGIGHHQLLFTTEGKGKIKLGGSVREISKNSVMYLKPGTPQYYYPVTDSWNVMWITYVQNTTFDILSMESGIYKLISAEPYTNIISLMLKGTGTLNFSKNASMLLYNLLIELHDNLNNAGYSDNISKLQRAVEYIEHNFTEQIETPYLAEISNITPEHFCRLFKKAYHMRPLEYIQKLRLQEAKRILITHPNMNISEVSKICGYDSPSYFIKQFKSKENITPTEFRHTHGK